MSLSVATEVTYGSWIYTPSRWTEAFDANAAAALTSGFWCAFTAARFVLAFSTVAAEGCFGVARARGVRRSGGWGVLEGLVERERLVAGLFARRDAVGRDLLRGRGAHHDVAGLDSERIALGRRMFPLDGFAQATFELGAATGAGVGPFIAAAAYRRTKDPATIPMTCVAAGIGALGALAVALAANAREKRRDEVAEEDGDEEIAALVRPLLDTREDGDSDHRPGSGGFGNPS